MRLVPAVTSQNVYWFNFCVNRLWPFVSLRFLSKSLKLPVDWAEAFTFDCLTFIVAFLKFCLKSTLLWQKTTLPLIQKHFPMWLVHYVLEQIIISAWLRHVIQEKNRRKVLEFLSPWRKDLHPCSAQPSRRFTWEVGQDVFNTDVSSLRVVVQCTQLESAGIYILMWLDVYNDIKKRVVMKCMLI